MASVEGKESKKADNRNYTEVHRMKRIGKVSEEVETERNFEQAFWKYSDQKMKRKAVQEFHDDLEKNLKALFDAYRNETWVTSGYTKKMVYHPKVRPVHKLPVKDHVIQHAVMIPVEDKLRQTLYWRSPAGTKGKGTHYFYEMMKRDVYSHPQSETFYCVPLDIHHYFQNVDHGLLKKEYRRKIKDRKLLRFLDEVVDSFNPGIVLGLKLAQLLGQLFLSRFDYLAIRCFGILDDVERFRYWQSRYVTDSFVTCRTPDEAKELAKGVGYMNQKFERYCREGLKHYSRFMDNIYILHGDKAFIRIMAELAVMHLARDWLLSVNKGWNVRRLCDGIDMCGQVLYPDHALLRKRFKKDLCKQVNKLRKKGLSQREIELKAAPRLGLGIHADSKHLYKSICMERFGKLVKKRKFRAPFEGMNKEQKLSIEDIVCLEGQDENKFLIQMIDYKVEDSVIEKEVVSVKETDEHGETKEVMKEVPKKCLAFRFRKIDHVVGEGDDAEEVWENEEHFTYTGSTVLIDQALNDFSRDELPFSTVVMEFKNKFKKKFYKFT